MSGEAKHSGGPAWMRPTRLPSVNMSRSDLARFEAKFEPEPMSGCWLWLAAVDYNGYGRFYINGSVHRAHRVAFAHFIGPIPEGLEIDHRCRQRCCVNPDHLEAVTHQQNMHRGDTVCAGLAERTHCKSGHRFTKENTHVYKGARYCRACRRATSRKLYRRAALLARIKEEGW